MANPPRFFIREEKSHFLRLSFLGEGHFRYPAEIRKIIYTTNIIESYHRQLRKVTKPKSVFPTDDSLLKILYLITVDITKKWTGRIQNWGLILAQFSIYFEDRLGGYIR